MCDQICKKRSYMCTTSNTQISQPVYRYFNLQMNHACVKVLWPTAQQFAFPEAVF